MPCSSSDMMSKMAKHVRLPNRRRNAPRLGSLPVLRTQRVSRNGDSQFAFHAIAECAPREGRFECPGSSATSLIGMAESFDSLPLRAALVDIARDFHGRGWMAGTAGNLSARVDREHFWITASGKPKGRLQETDFLLVRVDDGAVVERLAAQDKPSAETSIHRVIYALFPDAHACLHGHSIEACVAADRAATAAAGLLLPPLEMVKGFDLWEQSPKVELPLFENLLDVAQIAESVRSRFRETAPKVSALMVRSHGATVWGRSLQEAYNRFEVLDFLLAYLARIDRSS